MNDLELLQGLQSRQAVAFRYLVEHYQTKVFNTVLAIVQHPEEAEDVAQEVFMEVYESIDKFRGESKVSSWIYRKWYENRQLAEQRTYHKNHKNGLHKGWWPNGIPKFDYHFSEDVATGTHHEWFENGQMYSLSTYNNEGQPEGKQQMWYVNGQIKANYVIQNGRRFGLLGAKGCMGENERGANSIKI
ncbi:sigma factor [Runella limosa]|uniref:sigma factor n=1 Tax=Runella limosa TaxID=370978 RepID=UPI00042531B3|nr:sigma factor [Runella limosa]